MTDRPESSARLTISSLNTNIGTEIGSSPATPTSIIPTITVATIPSPRRNPLHGRNTLSRMQADSDNDFSDEMTSVADDTGNDEEGISLLTSARLLEVADIGAHVIDSVSTIDIHTTTTNEDADDDMENAIILEGSNQTVFGTRVLTSPPTAQLQNLPMGPSSSLAIAGSSKDKLSRQEEDVVYCLQLLAYISKYTFLRREFQQTHDLPNLRHKLGRLATTDEGDREEDETSCCNPPDLDEDLVAELQLPFNLFCLVEKFTLNTHSKEVQYWAGVIMRNACRKDEVRGGIRQCAYLQCGKWEEFNRQFAKCRRCRCETSAVP